jgi:hypothetical protein
MPLMGPLLFLPQKCSKSRLHRDPQPTWVVTMRIPYVIDNIEYRLVDVLKYLLQREQRQQVDVATAYFSIRGFEQVREILPSVRRFRLLLGDKPLEGEDIGLRPDSAAYLRHELNAEPFTASTAIPGGV